MTKQDCTDAPSTKQYGVAKCTKCGALKSRSLFYKDRKSASGYKSCCKTCHYQYVDSYKKTKEGLVFMIYSTQKTNSKKRGHPPPQYSKIELLNWCLEQGVFHELFESWIASAYDSWLIPSVDRVNDDRGYFFGNIQLMTWRHNSNKSKEGTLRELSSKRVKQYSLEMVFIKEYDSAHQASRDTGVSRQGISKVCAGKVIKVGSDSDGNAVFSKPRTAGGYIWKFTEK